MSFISAREARASRLFVVVDVRLGAPGKSFAVIFPTSRPARDGQSSSPTFARRKNPSSRNPTETGAQQRSEGARMGRGSDCRAVRAAWCASLVTLALVARAKGEVATYSGACDVIPEPPRLIPRI